MDELKPRWKPNSDIPDQDVRFLASLEEVDLWLAEYVHNGDAYVWLMFASDERKLATTRAYNFDSWQVVDGMLVQPDEDHTDLHIGTHEIAQAYMLLKERGLLDV